MYIERRRTRAQMTGDLPRHVNARSQVWGTFSNDQPTYIRLIKTIAVFQKYILLIKLNKITYKDRIFGANESYYLNILFIANFKNHA